MTIACGNEPACAATALVGGLMIERPRQVVPAGARRGDPLIT